MMNVYEISVSDKEEALGRGFYLLEDVWTDALSDESEVRRRLEDVIVKSKN